MKKHEGMTRRNFLFSSGAAAAGVLITNMERLHFPYSRQEALSLEEYFQEQLDKSGIPGLAACIVKHGRTVWAKGFGWADVAGKKPMDAENSIMNIGSISKTFTATAVMQLWEREKFKLDDDVNDYLSFSVRNPRYPEEPITFRQLLTHRSSIKDGDSYSENYRCGDPVLTLHDWLFGYFSSDGEYYDADQNFHSWKPGEKGKLPRNPRNYTNVGFGLLGYLVEVISGLPFNQYCRANIFEPLKMNDTGWFIHEIDRSSHAVPYIQNPVDDDSPAARELREMGFLGGAAETAPNGKTFLPHCLYSFPNYPDGLVRTSVASLAKFMSAYLEGGEPILNADTVGRMLSVQNPADDRQGLCWAIQYLQDEKKFWGHSGGDPGIRTVMLFLPGEGTGIILFANGEQAPFGALIRRLLEETSRL